MANLLVVERLSTLCAHRYPAAPRAPTHAAHGNDQGNSVARETPIPLTRKAVLHHRTAEVPDNRMELDVEPLSGGGRQAPLKQMRHSELRPDAAAVLLGISELKCRGTPDHLQFRELRDCRDEIIRSEKYCWLTSPLSFASGSTAMDASEVGPLESGFTADWGRSAPPLRQCSSGFQCAPRPGACIPGKLGNGRHAERSLPAPPANRQSSARRA